MPALQTLLQPNQNKPMPQSAPPGAMSPNSAPPIPQPGAMKPPGLPAGGPPPMPPGAGLAPAGNQQGRDMRTKLQEGDKKMLQELSAKGMQMLHGKELTSKLERLVQQDEDVGIIMADIADDIMLELDKQVPNGVPVAVVAVVTILILSELAKIISTITGEMPDKSTMKLALVRTLESVVGKDKLKELSGKGLSDEGKPAPPNPAPPGMPGAMKPPGAMSGMVR